MAARNGAHKPTASPSAPLHADVFQSTPPKRSRIRFPADDRELNRSGSSEGSSLYASLGLGPAPILRNSHMGPEEAGTSRDGDRRRVMSVDATPMLAAGSPSREPRATRRSLEVGVSPRRAKRSSRGLAAAAAAAAAAEHARLPGNDEEFDLSYEDPRIQEDVDRALKLKARREARLRASRVHSPIRNVAAVSTRSEEDSGPSMSSRSSPTPMSFPGLTTNTSYGSSQPPAPASEEADIDFSPSVGSVPSHPVPSSLNDGATLDWSVARLEDEKTDRHWGLPLPKRRKEKGRGPVIEQQASLYSDKLARIKSQAHNNTLRKAIITADQLGRRYEMLFASMDPPLRRLNSVDVVRWFDSQDSTLRRNIDEAEPLTWSKHLVDKSRSKDSGRFPWHLTALMVAEYAMSRGPPDAMETIPEDAVASPKDNTPSTGGRGPFRNSRSRPQSLLSLEPSISRRLSNDGYVSFEPQVDSRRNSLGADSRKSHDVLFKNWRGALSNAETPRSSMSSQRHVDHRSISPISSRLLPSGFNKGSHRSDDGSSSAHGSLLDERSSNSDDPRSEAESAKHRKLVRRPHESAVHERGHARDEPTETGQSASAVAVKDESEDISSATATAPTFPHNAEPVAKPKPAIPHRSSTAPTAVEVRTLPPRRMRRSLPAFPTPLLRKEEYKRQYAADEERERVEYDLKARLLEDTAAQNHRIRQVLQRVSVNVKEYEAVQATFAKLLGVPYEHLPDELLDAFNHDPSAVTSGTRRLKGWRAVEDIHRRIIRQRDTLQAFIQTASGAMPVCPPSGGMFGDTVAKLSATLAQLEREREHITVEAQEAAEELAEVKTLQANVKKKYNETLTTVSIVYPELTQIVSLEESYKDYYQHLWEFGMDALTLLLDTVTPIWRNYGKTIGDDVQDFLIIPWYRNEFTGEARRYPITALPTRSFRHWLGLLVFSFGSVAVLVLQGRTAVMTASYYSLPGVTHPLLWWIILPIFWTGLTLQWFAVLMEASIVAAELGVVVWWLGWSVKLFS